MNLLHETREAIEGFGLTVNDIVFIGSEDSGHACTWEEFESLANHEYDHSYGSQEVAKDLIIAFSTGHKMVRGEYDGSEWWELNAPFKPPIETKKITALIGGMWEDLEGLNSEKKD